MKFKCFSSDLHKLIPVMVLISLGSVLGCQRLPTSEPKSFQPLHRTTATTTAINTFTPIPSNTPTKTPRPTKTKIPESPTFSVDLSRSRFIAALATDKTQDIPRLYLFKFGENHLFRPFEDSFTHEPLSWSPDGQFLVASSSTEEEKLWVFMLYKIDVSSMDVMKLIPQYQNSSTTSELKMDVPSWSWDIPEIAFSRGYDQIQLMTLDGSTQLLTEGFYPVWLDGSTAIAFLHLEMDESMGRFNNFGDIFRFDFDTKQEKQMTGGRRVHMLASSPDGKWIAFDDLLSPGSIYLMKSNGSEPSYEITKNAGAFSWDPDGNHLFFAKDCQIYRTNLDGSMIEKVNLPKDYCYWYAALQPKNGTIE